MAARALVVATLLVGVRPAHADRVKVEGAGWIASAGVGLDVGTPFAEGALVVTRVTAAAATTAKVTPANGNPLMPAQRGPGGFGGPPPGR